MPVPGLYRNHASRRAISLMLVDGSLVGLGVLLSIVIRFAMPDRGLQDLSEIPLGRVLVVLAVAIFFQLSAYYVLDLYDLPLTRYRSRQANRILVGTGVGALIIAALFFLLPPIRLGRSVFVIQFVLTSGLILGWRMAALRYWSGLSAPVRLLLVGRDAVYEVMMSDSHGGSSLPVEVLGTVVPDGDKGCGRLVSTPCYDNITDAVAASDPDLVLLPSKYGTLSQALMEEAIRLKFDGLEFLDALTFYEIHHGKVPLEYVSSHWLLYTANSHVFGNSYSQNLKRVIDVVISLIGCVLMLPIMAILALLIWFESGRPILFRQERYGKNRRPIEILKFRTMVPDAEKKTGPVWAAAHDPRTTPLGRFLRRSRLDELPQLFNILCGQMSLVGPRPIRQYFANQLEQQLPFYDLRFALKPGLTGWAQVHTDYSGSFKGQKEKLQYDLYYVQNASILLDTIIMARTINTLLFRQGQ